MSPEHLLYTFLGFLGTCMVSAIAYFISRDRDIIDKKLLSFGSEIKEIEGRLLDKSMVERLSRFMNEETALRLSLQAQDAKIQRQDDRLHQDKLRLDAQALEIGSVREQLSTLASRLDNDVSSIKHSLGDLASAFSKLAEKLPAEGTRSDRVTTSENIRPEQTSRGVGEVP